MDTMDTATYDNSHFKDPGSFFIAGKHSYTDKYFHSEKLESQATDASQSLP